MLEFYLSWDHSRFTWGSFSSLLQVSHIIETSPGRQGDGLVGKEILMPFRVIIWQSTREHGIFRRDISFSEKRYEEPMTIFCNPFPYYPATPLPTKKSLKRHMKSSGEPQKQESLTSLPQTFLSRIKIRQKRGRRKKIQRFVCLFVFNFQA